MVGARDRDRAGGVRRHRPRLDHRHDPAAARRAGACGASPRRCCVPARATRSASTARTRRATPSTRARSCSSRTPRDSCSGGVRGLALGRGRRVVRLGRRRQARASPLDRTVIYEGHLKGLSQAASARPAGPARHVRGPRPPRDDRALPEPRRHDASSCCRCTRSRPSRGCCSTASRTTGATTR